MFAGKPALEAALAVASSTPELDSVVQAMLQRATEFGSSDRATLAGLASTPRGRLLLETAVGRHFETTTQSLNTRYGYTQNTGEVVIGSGVHSAVYSANKCDLGVTPLTIEARDRAGGVFALSRRPVFFLNSRNRPDRELQRRGPGTAAPLNSLPGALVQPSDVSYAEYPDQTDMSFLAALTLALYGFVWLRKEVVQIEANPAGLALYLRAPGLRRPQTRPLVTQRVILATGLGKDRVPFRVGQDAEGEGFRTFSQFIQEVGDPSNTFPLREYNDVAVIGAGDSANVTVEYLLGQGPQPGGSPAQLDTVDRITWIGQSELDDVDFRACNRSRYQGISRYFPREGDSGRYSRIKPAPGKAVSVEYLGPARLMVRWLNDEGEVQRGSFDHVICCAGFEDRSDELLPEGYEFEPYSVDGVTVAKKAVGHEIYRVGPAADLPLDRQERDNSVVAAVGENVTSLFRYTDRTAALARHLARREAELEPGVVVGPLKVPQIVPSSGRTTIYQPNLADTTFPNPYWPEGMSADDGLRLVAHQYIPYRDRYESKTVSVTLRAVRGGWQRQGGIRVDLQDSMERMLRDPMLIALYQMYDPELVMRFEWRNDSLYLPGVRVERP